MGFLCTTENNLCDQGLGKSRGRGGGGFTGALLRVARRGENSILSVERRMIMACFFY